MLRDYIVELLFKDRKEDIKMVNSEFGILIHQIIVEFPHENPFTTKSSEPMEPPQQISPGILGLAGTPANYTLGPCNNNHSCKVCVSNNKVKIENDN